jgi:NTE family protein
MLLELNMQDTSSALHSAKTSPLPGRVVLVMQGGGAPGCYQAGAYQALHEAGIEPDWIIGTSIGAINGAIIAGNDGPGRVENCGNFGISSIPGCRSH